MTIVWEPNEYVPQKGTDELGNRYHISANQTVTCRTPDDFSGCSWTAKEALAAAMSEKENARKSWQTQQPITLSGPHDLEAADQDYWSKRASILLDQPTVVQPAIPINFNRHDWTGSTGTIYPTGPNAFIIEDIEGQWTMTEREVIVTMTNEDGRQYHGFKSVHNGNTIFSEMACEHGDEDPRIAFAQVMYNL